MPLKKLILSFCFSILLANLSYSQIWPFTPMTRFGNVVYIDTQKVSISDLNDEQILFESGLNDRFFDVLISTDSLEIEIDNKPELFFQKNRRAPKNRRTLAFFSRRKLENKNLKITYLKIKNIEQNQIIAEATIKNKRSGPRREMKLVTINIDELEGVFLGPNKGYRTITIVAAIAGGVGVLFLN